MSDVPALLELASEYFNEIKPETDINYDWLASNLIGAISSSVHFVLVYGDKIQGVVWGMLAQTVWSEDLVLIDHILYVRKKYRGTMAGPSLMRAYDKLGKKYARSIQATVLSGIDEDRTAQIYSRLGYKLSGIYATKEVKCHQHERKQREQ